MHSRFSVVVAFLLVALVLSHAFGKDEKRGKRLVATDGQRRNLDSKSKGKKGTPEDDGVSNDANDDPFMCQDFPETWDESLLVAEAKQWPDAAKSQPPLDLSGEYLPAGVTLPPGIKCAQRIWQECLEITITGGCINEATGEQVSGSPLHHYIMDYTYVHIDMVGNQLCPGELVNGNCFAIVGPTQNKALIVQATREYCELYGSEHAMMIVGSSIREGPGVTRWAAVRTRDREGSLIFEQNQATTGGQGQQRAIFELVADIECNGNSGWNPDSAFCQSRSYLDVPWSYTPACCVANELDVFTATMDPDLYPPVSVQIFPNGPNVVSCDGSTLARAY